jgi:Domain of unknown function (DUF4266)
MSPLRPWTATMHNLALMAMIAATSSGCASFGQVEAFEKGDLAREEMTFGGNPLEAKFHEHIYASKENATGGSGVGGGGCGCN